MKQLHFPFLILLFIYFFFPIQSHSKTILVCPTCEFTNLENAILKAIKNDIIEIQKGLYIAQRVIVDKPLIIRGADYPVLDGKGEPILLITSDSVTIQGIEFRNVSTSYVEDKAAIRIIKSNYCSIIDNKIFDTFFAIYIEHSHHATISKNYIKGDAKQEASSGNAVHAWYSNYALIERNTLINHRDGIYLEFVEHSEIEGNHSEGNIRYGLHFMFSHHDTYTNNVFKNNGSGVAVMFSNRVDMFNNVFEDNWGDSSYGLLLKDIKDSQLIGNLFKRNTTAIQADNAMRISMTMNTFESNGWAMKIYGNCMENTIIKNNFFSNSFDISTNSAFNHNTFDHNYWASYTGYDLDKDGIGDIPFRPVSLFSYTVTNNPPTLILMRSTFIEILNSAEKVIPVITPETLFDENPLMKPIVYDRN